jgi:TRAP transporter TAXI family solute receptor
MLHRPHRRIYGVAVLNGRVPFALRAVISCLLVAALAATTGCGARPEPTPRRLYLATGNTTGVYYQLGGGYADLITRYMPDWQAVAEPTGASVDNIRRVTRGDADIAFTLADVAADAAQGVGAFSAPQPIRALARIYVNHTHLIARAGTGIKTVTDLRGKRVSTGSPHSGTEIIALRTLRAVGLDPVTDVARQSMSLPETVQAMTRGTIDAMFWSGGLPTGGILDLIATVGSGVVFIPLGVTLAPLQALYGPVYQPGTLPKDAYKTAADVATITVPNLLVVRSDMPDQLAATLTKLLFEHLEELAKVHPEGRNILLANGSNTNPVIVHPGAAAFYAAH